MTKPKIAFIDHYDSFSFNVLDWLYRAGVDGKELLYVRCDDQEGLLSAKNLKIPLVFSPGPHHPKDIPLSQELVRNSLGLVPMLGICLGHQLFGFVAGASVVPAKDPWHGSKQRIRVTANEAIFAGIPDSFEAASYNSLVVDHSEIAKAKDWKILAVNSEDEVMALSRTAPGAPAWSVQFHPESFMSEFGWQMAKNWVQCVLQSS